MEVTQVINMLVTVQNVTAVANSSGTLLLGVYLLLRGGVTNPVVQKTVWYMFLWGVGVVLSEVTWVTNAMDRWSVYHLSWMIGWSLANWSFYYISIIHYASRGDSVPSSFKVVVLIVNVLLLLHIILMRGIWVDHHWYTDRLVTLSASTVHYVYCMWISAALVWHYLFRVACETDRASVARSLVVLGVVSGSAIFYFGRLLLAVVSFTNMFAMGVAFLFLMVVMIQIVVAILVLCAFLPTHIYEKLYSKLKWLDMAVKKYVSIELERVYDELSAISKAGDLALSSQRVPTAFVSAILDSKYTILHFHKQEQNVNRVFKMVNQIDDRQSLRRLASAYSQIGFRMRMREVIG